MATFEGAKYKPKGDVYLDDGREIRLLHWIYKHPNLQQMRNSPSAVLAAIDEYARTEMYLMNVGEHKGVIVTALIAEAKSRTMVELGGYVGYSALMFGAALRAANASTGTNEARYYSLERNPEFAAVAMSLVSLAGLSDTVEVVVGSSADSLRRLHAAGSLRRIDLLFVDHYKPAYVTDLKLCEELGLIGVGSVIAADNCISPGNPAYLEYVRASPAEKREMYEAAKEGKGPSGWDERIPERARNQYLKSEGKIELDTSIVGRPGLEYDSKMVESFNPTGERDGVEVSRCVGDNSVLRRTLRE